MYFLGQYLLWSTKQNSYNLHRLRVLQWIVPTTGRHLLGNTVTEIATASPQVQDMNSSEANKNSTPRKGCNSTYENNMNIQTKERTRNIVYKGDYWALNFRFFTWTTICLFTSKLICWALVYGPWIYQFSKLHILVHVRLWIELFSETMTVWISNNFAS